MSCFQCDFDEAWDTYFVCFSCLWGILANVSLLLLLLLSRFSRVQLCATPWTAAHQAPPSPGLSRQEHRSGLPFPSPMHGSEKSKGSRSVVSDSPRPYGLQPTRLLHPWDPPGKRKSWVTHYLQKLPHSFIRKVLTMH